MAKQHELLAAEKTTTTAWSELLLETRKKFGNPDTYYHGHSRTLSMLEQSDANIATEEAERSEKPVTTTVFDTLEWAFGIFERAEQLQYQKNQTNTRAKATIMWKGAPFLEDVPVDELMGLEKRLLQIRELMLVVPTLDASKHWQKAPQLGPHIWEVKFPIEKTKGDKRLQVVTMSEATEHHPAQVHTEHKDVPVGKYTTIQRSGEATAVQKSEAIRRIDDFLIEVKSARMRANETEVVQSESFAQELVEFLLEPFLMN